MDEMLTSALRVAKTEKDVENLFCKFNIKEKEEKINYLEHAMYDPLTFYSCGEENAPIDQKYTLTMGMFLKGHWKLHEFYEKAGL